jgi:PAS domain S-box-containing protein
MSETKILVVEDEAIIAKDIEQTLWDFGYTVPAIASSGEEAIQKAQETQPDLVLMDIVLKGRIGGIEAAREIRAKLGTPIVFLTAYADEIMLSQAKVAEPSGYLVKPFQPHELRSTIEVALYKSQMDRRLKEREQWLSGTLRSIDEGVITTASDGSIVLMNPLAEFLTEWKAEEAVGRPLGEVFQATHEGSGEKIALPLEKVTRERLTFGQGHSVLLNGKNGRKRPIEFRISPIGEKETNLLGTVLVFRDITEKKKAEEAIRQERELLEGITQNIGAGVTVISKDYRILWANRVIKQLFGETEGALCYSTFHQSGEVCPNCGVKEVFDKKRDRAVYESARKDKEGNPIWSEVIVTPLRDGEGNISSAIELVVPITERKKIQEEIERIRLRNEMILNSAGEGILGLDPHGKVTFVNQFGASLLGYEVKELLGKGIHRIWNPMIEEGNPILEEKCPILRSLKEGSSLHRATDVFWKKDGTSFSAEYSCKPFKENDRIGGAVIVFRDITQRKRAMDELRANEEKAKRLAEKNRILMEIGRIVSSTLKIEEVYERFVDEARKLIPADRISVLTLDDQKTILTIRYVWGAPLPDRKVGDLTPCPPSLLGRFRQRSQP